MGILKPEDIYIQNDYYDDVVNDPAKYNYQDTHKVLYEASKRHIKGFNILDYIFINSVENDYLVTFINELKEEELYEEYIERTINGNDSFLKAYICVFMEPWNMNLIYNSKFKVAQDLAKKGDDYSVNQRILGLMELSCFNPDERTVKYIKNSIKKLIYQNSFYKNNYDKTMLKEEVNDYYKYIDEHAYVHKLKNE